MFAVILALVAGTIRLVGSNANNAFSSAVSINRLGRLLVDSLTATWVSHSVEHPFRNSRSSPIVDRMPGS
jgi:hypothetical protein